MEAYLPVTESNAMLQYGSLIVERHQLLKDMPKEVEEEGGGEDLWRVEDELTLYWQELDAAQRQAVNGLTSDLAWVRRGGTLAPKSHSASEVQSKHIWQLFETLQKNSIYESLHYVRVALPLIGGNLAGVMRASLYLAAFSGVAKREFFEFHLKDMYTYIHLVQKLAIPQSPIEWTLLLTNGHSYLKKINEYLKNLLYHESLLLNDPLHLKAEIVVSPSQSFAASLASRMLTSLPWPMSLAFLKDAIETEMQSAPIIE